MPRRDHVPLKALLKGLEVDRVDFVGAGANGESDIVLFKSHRGTRYVPKTNGGTMPAPVAKTADELAAEALQKSIDEAVAKGVEAALKARDDAEAEATAKAAEAAEKAKKKPPFLEKDDEDDKTDPDVKKAIAKAVEDAVAVEKAAREQLAKELDEVKKERAEQIFLAKGATMPTLGSPAEVANVLKTVAAGDPNAAEAVETMLKAANERLEKSGLLTELGVAHGGDTSGDPQAQLMAKAEGFMKDDPKLSMSDALTKAVAESPGAYADFRKNFKTGS